VQKSFLQRASCVLLLPLALMGCVGFVTSKLEYINVQSDMKTKEDVLKQFGKPRRTAREHELDVWYYMLHDRIATEGVNAVFLIIVPLIWTTKVEANAKVVFRGDQVLEVLELKDTGGGFMCSAFDSHTLPAGCHMW